SLSRGWWSDIPSGPRTLTISRRRVPDYPKRHQGRTRSLLTAKKPHLRRACAVGQGLEDDAGYATIRQTARAFTGASQFGGEANHDSQGAGACVTDGGDPSVPAATA